MPDQDPPVIPWTHEKPLFLAPAARAGDPTGEDHTRRGYMTRPLRPLENKFQADPPEVVERIAAATRLCDEPEIIGAAIVNGYTELADFQHTLRHQQAVQAARVLRPQLDAEARIRDAERRAKQAHRAKQLHAEFRVMRRMLDQANAGGRKTPASLITKIVRVEMELDGIDENGKPLAA